MRNERDGRAGLAVLRGTFIVQNLAACSFDSHSNFLVRFGIFSTTQTHSLSLLIPGIIVVGPVGLGAA